MKGSSFEVSFLDSGREPQVASNPLYPDGMDLDMSQGLESCFTPLPYPALRIGVWRLRCLTCGLTLAVTAAGRRDDPRSVRVACKVKLQ